MTAHRIFTTSFASIHSLYVAKVERKGHTSEEVDRIICWLTGHDAVSLQQVIAADDPLMQQIRWMDKLVDEVARGKTMSSILRGGTVVGP